MTQTITDTATMEFYQKRLETELAIIANSNDPTATAVHRALADNYQAMIEAADTAAFVGKASSSSPPPALTTDARPSGTGPAMHPSKHPVPGKNPGGSGSTSR